jgi:hypothetical protein
MSFRRSHNGIMPLWHLIATAEMAGDATPVVYGSRKVHDIVDCESQTDHSH